MPCGHIFKRPCDKGPQHIEWKDYKNFRTLDVKLIYYVVMFLVETKTSFIIKDTLWLSSMLYVKETVTLQSQCRLSFLIRATQPRNFRGKYCCEKWVLPNKEYWGPTQAADCTVRTPLRASLLSSAKWEDGPINPVVSFIHLDVKGSVAVSHTGV